MSNKIIDHLDFTNFKVCVNCIKVKQTSIRKFISNKTLDILELTYIDVCGPFLMVIWNGQQYFIIFIDDFSRYSYVYLISDLTVVVSTMVEMIVHENNI